METEEKLREKGESEKNLERMEEVLSKKGFNPLARFTYGVQSAAFWNTNKNFELLVTKAGEDYLLKGMKKYYIQGVSEEGRQTWDRNLGKLMDRLQSSFSETHLYAANLNEVPESILPEDEAVEGKIEKKQVDIEENEEKISKLKEAVVEHGKAIRSHDMWEEADDALRYIFTPADKRKEKAESRKENRERRKKERKADHKELKRDVDRKTKRLRRKVDRLEDEVEDLKDRRHEFMAQFSRKGAANSMIIACSTPLRVANLDNFQSQLEAVIEDIEVEHTHGGFTQALDKGLGINYEEVQYPWITHQAEFVGLFSPDEAKDTKIYQRMKPFFYATALEDIKVGGKVKKKGKKTPAWVMKAFLDRVEASSTEETETKDVPTEGGWIGNLIQGEEVTDTPFLFDLDRLNHGYLSGTTGSGKTYTARVLVENAILKGVNVVVLDTTRQWCGLAKPASGTKKRLKKLGVDRDLPTGFPADIYTPNSSAGKQLSQNLSDLADGVSVVTLKGLYDEERCEIARDVLSDIYMSTDQETEQLKTLMVIEEAHTFLPGNVDPSAKEVAKECEKRIERISREARKYGLNLLVVSQSLSDFKRSSKTVREMMNSKFFMRATDRSEINYVEDYVSKEAAGWVRNLDVGEVLVNSPGVGPAKVFIRPPFSEVGELSDSEIEEAVGAQEEKFEGVDKGDFLAKVSAVKEGEVKAKPETPNLSEEEEKLIQVAKKHLEEEDEPIHLTKAAEKAEIYSMGRLSELVEDLEERGVIETKKLKKRGNPRGIIPKT